jgi:hypothetical protein
VTKAPCTGRTEVLYRNRIYDVRWRLEGDRLVVDLEGDTSIQPVGLLSGQPETLARLIVLNRLRRAQRPQDCARPTSGSWSSP